MGSGGKGVGECFTLAGFIKIVESFSVFTCLMLHRIGDQGYQVFFGASDKVLNREDVTYPMESDAEILGAGTVTAFAIITPMILLAYALEGRKAIQATSVDAIFCFVAACTLIASGGMCCFAWNHANENVGSVSRRDFEAAGALGIMCIVSGLIYLVDFFYTMYQNALVAEDQYYD